MLKSLFFAIVAMFLNIAVIEPNGVLNGYETSQSSSSSSSNNTSFFDLDISEEPYHEPIEFTAVHKVDDDNATCSIDRLFGIRSSIAGSSFNGPFNFSNICLLDGATEAALLIRYTSGSNVVEEEQCVYISKTSWGCFLSTRSIDYAHFQARLWGLRNGGVTLQEHDEHNLNTNGRFIEFLADNRQQTNDGSCLIQWKNDDGVLKPLRKIELSFEGEAGALFLETNDDGVVSYSRYNLQSLGFPAKVKIFAKTKYGGVNFEENKIGIYSNNDLLSYYVVLSLETFLSCQSITIKSCDEPSGRFSLLGRAFGICQAIYYGGKYFEEMEGYALNYVNVWYPRSEEGAIHFNDKGIEISEYVYKYWDVILHEYGHAVQRVKNISDNPGGEHYIDSHFSKNEGWNGTKDGGLKVVWGESWPTVFGNLVTKKYINDLTGMNYVGDNIYTSNTNGDNQFWRDLETPNIVKDYGEGSEITTIAVLYDLFDDGQNEEFDLIALGHQRFWNLIMDSQAKTFSEFARYCYESNIIDNNNFGLITGHYGMSVKDVFIDNVDDYNTSDPPTFSWAKCNKDYLAYESNGTYSSNKYDIEFLDEARRVVVSQLGLSQEFYTPGQDAWFNIQASSNDTIRIRITAYQDNYGYETGGYLSNIFELEPPNSDLHHSGTFSANTRILEDSVIIMPFSKLSYEMRSERAGRRVFQTFGPNDTIMSIYKKEITPIFSAHGFHLREDWILVGEDDNSGNDYNSLIVLDCTANTDYLIVVENKCQYSQGQSRLIINQINDSISVNSYSGFNNYQITNIYLYLYLDQYCSTSFTVSPLYSTTYNITVTSGFDSYLYVLDPTSGYAMIYQIEYDDDSNGNLDAALSVYLETNKDYYVIVTQYNPSENISNSSTLCIRFD